MFRRKEIDKDLREYLKNNIILQFPTYLVGHMITFKVVKVTEKTITIRLWLQDKVTEVTREGVFETLCLAINHLSSGMKD
jgi:hypothetical protein